MARRVRSFRVPEAVLHSRMPGRWPAPADEQTSLLGDTDASRSYLTLPASLSASNASTPRQRLSRSLSESTAPQTYPQSSAHSNVGSGHDAYVPHSLSLRHHSRSGSGSFGQRLYSALSSSRARDFGENLEDSKASLLPNDRVWYDQFTSTDWVHDSIADAFRLKQLRSRRDIRGRLVAWFDSAQGWIVVAIIGCITAIIAYFVDVTESAIFDFKGGYCGQGWFYSHRKCCLDAEVCGAWKPWSSLVRVPGVEDDWVDFGVYVAAILLLATSSAFLTMMSKTVVPSLMQLSTLDENLGAENRRAGSKREAHGATRKSGRRFAGPSLTDAAAPMVYYSAAGSGVAEVKVILSGFVLHGYLGAKTLVVKTLALILSVASGLSIGKEGPFVHIATCVGNVACRLFSKYNNNDGKRREVLSASAASGVAVAFGAPIGGVLFSLEEVSYYFPPKTLFRTFFCCIAAALSLKFLNPYGTNKIVIFEVRYDADWMFFEMIAFIMLGILGGALGALFIKASRFWAQTFRRIPLIKKGPVFEVMLVALITGLLSYWNRFTKLPVTELLLELASPCSDRTGEAAGTGLCPRGDDIPDVIGYLLVAFLIKSFLTTITFGIKVPAGIYVPSMVVGGLMGRIVGHLVQYIVYLNPDAELFSSCPQGGDSVSCVEPGVYAMVAAGATMCGVTRLSVTLAVILFELTGSLDHVLPFSIAILVSKWTADALEPLSIYDLLTDMNSYPFLDNKIRPIFTEELGDLTPRRRPDRIIDISHSPIVPAIDLRRKLQLLHLAGELDSGLPVLRNNVLVGMIPAPDLEFALDRLDDEGLTLCLMSQNSDWDYSEEALHADVDPCDFTPFIDPAPVALEICSPMDLVYECFVKLGLRYICVLRNGQYAGLVHKKAFVKYVKELEAASH
ncbi:MAG: hypothetical protein M1832_000243 [Thelocarpon impressellum]|nr:MAG: hypothetical protein M1832_000243 [Thelocarpon impressellum]